MSIHASRPFSPALVSRASVRSNGPGEYLVVAADGASTWTPRPEAATVFSCMREATRVAIRLPAALRAFGLPMAGTGRLTDAELN